MREKSEGPTRVALIEDDGLLRAELAAKLSRHPDFAVIGQAENFQAARRLLSDLSCDILLVDLGLPDGDGLDLIAAASARYADLDIVVFTVFGAERQVVEAIRRGASGFVLKDDTQLEIVEALKQLRGGQAPISPGIARHLIRYVQGDSEESAAVGLSEREREVLRLASRGYSYREIAELLELSANTIATYTKRVYEKLAVSSRSEAVYEAQRLGLLKP